MTGEPLKLATTLSAAVAAALLLAAAGGGSLTGVTAQVFLTSVCVMAGAGLMRLQLWDWRVSAKSRPSKLRASGVAAVVVSQASFLILVWSHWRTGAAVWRLWWLSMVASLFVTHLLLIRAAGAGRWGGVERAAAVFVAWAGAMALWLGLRRHMLTQVAQAYWWVAAPAAAGAIITSAYLALRQLHRHRSLWKISRRAVVTALVASHFVLAAAAFYVGRATAKKTTDFSLDPVEIAAAAPGDIGAQWSRDKYQAQSKVAEYLGDTRIVSREPFIRVEQIDAIEPRFKTGDILLERRNWYLSNPWLPGFWPHAALYVGRMEDLVRLGIAEHPAVKAHLDEYLDPAADGRAKTVIEAVSEGVLLNSLAHSMHADYVAVLRPRVGDEVIATAVVRAFENLGKQYDFNFDFDDTTKLVCTQVVCLSYEGGLVFDLKRVMGRNTLPAVEIARKYVDERELPERQMDFVLFLDAVPDEGRAVEAGEGEFCASIERPRDLVER